MTFISCVGEKLAYVVARPLNAVATDGKRWIVLAGIVAGWATGVFFASNAILPKPAAIALVVICSYAGARLAADLCNIMSLFAQWLLQHAGQEGKAHLAKSQVVVLS